MLTPGRILFHSPCFDGIVSAAIAADFLEARLGWRLEEMRPVNYNLKHEWLSTRLKANTAIVDFLFHPDAAFWVDHHSTAFLDETTRTQYQRKRSPLFKYDGSADSCAGLLWTHLSRAFQYENLHFADMVEWTSVIDAAKYQSVDEALHGTAAALRISASLAYSDGDDYPVYLAHRLRESTLDEVADEAPVASRYHRYRTELTEGLARFQKGAWLDGDIVVFDVDAGDLLLPRYAPYEFYPNAYYSIGIIRRPDKTALTAMRNPWLEFRNLHLGRLFEQYGGGGHSRIGSLVLTASDVSRSAELLDELLTELKRGIAGRHAASRAAS